jgi:hypothetical protein
MEYSVIDIYIGIDDDGQNSCCSDQPHDGSLSTLTLNQMATTAPDQITENPLKSTINILDSLVAFYQHERMWVYRTRAILEEALPNPSIMDTTTQSISASSSLPIGNDEAPINEPLASHQTRWMRRKKGFKLRLDGIRPKRVISAIPVNQVRRPEYLHPREQLLEMFEKLMESRMESCQRINKLVRDANRANLHYR